MLGSSRIRTMAKHRALPALSPRKLPTQERARRTYLAILQAGARILERNGYVALTTVHVARAMRRALARSTRELGATGGTPPLPDAIVYLLATMTGAAMLEAVLRPPPEHSPEELIETLAEIVNRVTGTRERTQQRAARAASTKNRPT